MINKFHLKACAFCSQWCKVRLCKTLWSENWWNGIIITQIYSLKNSSFKFIFKKLKPIFEKNSFQNIFSAKLCCYDLSIKVQNCRNVQILSSIVKVCLKFNYCEKQKNICYKKVKMISICETSITKYSHFDREINAFSIFRKHS